ncbi:hypothetical protein [Periweissella fabalis]|uniref:Uncharacterized protein n=1 Tax=Periweissella fabalis TaxID=1070421 RepID=A0A7X6N545_9LACO|nr:hypothetical protein [Periweissella fabalis]MCM0599847.1 hypothetical protein [Periweissella fabalis]NKZ24098.1 hypothetical protein [Periweissella fabalis]
MALLALLFVSIGAFITHPTPLRAGFVVIVAILFVVIVPKLSRVIRKAIQQQNK